MKRFYEQAVASPRDDGWRIALDGKPVMSPGRRALAAPTRALVEAIAAEWNAQGDKIDPRAMPLTGLANAAIDRIALDPAPYVADLARYGESDLLCYRAERPAALIARQAEAWEPLLDWARARFGIAFTIVGGVIHEPQPEATVERLTRAVAALDAWRLAGLTPLVTIGGSLVAGLALAAEAFGEDAVWAALHIDEDWQAETWGMDHETAATRDARSREFGAGARFLRLLDE